MAFEVIVVEDSYDLNYAAGHGARITTIQATYPRCIHSELMTHRLFSRNAASSRAIPVEKMLAAIETEPFIPFHWGAAQKGMQADNQICDAAKFLAEAEWLNARDAAVESARKLLDLGLHKQIVNRILEPFAWITTVITSTQWDNFEILRCHPDAEPHFRKLADIVMAAIRESNPKDLEGGWHLPYLSEEDRHTYPLETRLLISVGRCAGVSYLRPGGRQDVSADYALGNRLKTSGHWSPFEHQAMATDIKGAGGNLGDGWLQYRKTFPNECVERRRMPHFRGANAT